MKIHRHEKFTRGWFIGDFDPALLRTEHFETAVKFFSAGDHEKAHYHSICREFTIIGAGHFRMNGKDLKAGDIVELAQGEIADFHCLEAGVTFVVKMPSAPTDKVLVES